jgi:uncharacterized protein DUF5691
MTTLDDLVAVASVGTSHKAVSLAGGEGALGEAMAVVETLPQASAEAKLLSAVAILAQYEACGRIPRPANAPDDAAPVVAAEESLPPCSPRAAAILGQILAMNNTATKDRLLAEWLELATRAGRRAPWRLLPALLDYGAAQRGRRSAIAQAAGARGAWLVRQNPRWQYAADEPDDPRAVWTTGTREQRLAAIGRLRQSDPAAARELIQSTWKEDAADDRAAFVMAIAAGLSDADEAFLESALDDRSKQVRTAAAEMLARLPAAALVRRMIERADPLVSLKPAVKGKLLRKGSPATIEITLPPGKLDPSWARDGIVEKPEGGMGQRQWWLHQVVGFIPTTHWSQEWNLTPQECVAAAASSEEFGDVVLEAWHQAARRHPDPAWVAALLLAAAKEGRGPLTVELLGQLPPDAREAITAEILESPKIEIEEVMSLIHGVPLAMGRHSATALFRRIEQNVRQQKQAAYNYVIAQILQEAACRVPPGFYDELAGRWTDEKWEQNRKSRDEFLQVLLLRRDLRREFEAPGE